MEILDLSTPLESNNGEVAPFVFKQIGHKKGGDIFGKRIVFKTKLGLFKKTKAIGKYLFGIDKIDHAVFPQGEFLNLEIIGATTHTGTHLDAPLHYGSTSEGKPAMSIDQVPLEWCFSDGVLLDVSHKKEDDKITLEDIKESLAKLKYKIKPFDIVLIRTDAALNWGKRNYSLHYPGIDREIIRYLVDEGVKIIGVDTFGVDRPFSKMLKDYFKSKNNSVLWPSHFYGREKSYCHIERLCNLHKLTRAYDFKVSCFPIKITNAGAAWTRVVAIL